MKWTVGIKIAAGFGLAMAIFLAVGAASYAATNDLIIASEWRKHTYRVLDNLDDTLPLLNDVELGARSYYLTDEPAYLKASEAASARIPEVFRKLRSVLGDNPRQQQRLTAVEALVKTRLEQVRDLSDVYRVQGQKVAASQIKTGTSKAVSEEIGRIVREMQEEERALLRRSTEAADATGKQALLTILVGTVSALAIALLAGGWITRNISRPLRQLTVCAQRIMVGDLAVDVPASPRSDEVGVLARAFQGMTQHLRGVAAAAEQMAAGNLRSVAEPQSSADILGNAFFRMNANLRDQIRSMVDAASVLGTSATDIVASTAQLAASASQSAAAVAETTATVEEVRQTAELASQKARAVSDTAQKAVTGSQSGRRSAADVSKGMERIRQQMEAIASSMGRMAEHSQTVGQIIATVEDLAAQSNLLSVNAAIEAAKAGEHGKGFAVVAQEVKSLAAQSRQATSQVRSVLGDIQAATASAVNASQLGGQAVEAGALQTAVASEAIESLSGNIIEAAQAATQIAASSQQQLIGVDQVAGAMDSINQASTQNVASARQLEEAARRLNDVGQRLKQIVSSYQL